MRDQLSNIIEEKSEVHNISSIKSSNLIQNIKVRKQTCNLCGEDGMDTDESKLSKYQNILIYPCLCPLVAHRACIKSYIIENQITTCPTCKTNYAVGKSSTNMIANITPNMIHGWIGKFMLFLIFLIIIIIFILFINGYTSQNPLIAVWKGVLFVLFGTIIALSLIYAACSLKLALKKLRRSEIEIYCNQTEIGYHSQNPKEILKDYFENNYDSMVESLRNRSIERRKYAQSAPNFKKKGDNRIVKEIKSDREDDEEPLSKILNLATDQDNLENKIKVIDHRIAAETKTPARLPYPHHEKKASIEIEKITKKIEELSPVGKQLEQNNLEIKLQTEEKTPNKINKRAKSEDQRRMTRDEKPQDPNSIVLNFSMEKRDQNAAPNKEETLSLEITIQENANN